MVSRLPAPWRWTLLLLGEPTEGLSPAIVPASLDGIASIRQLGLC